jgi:hypothetical protein
MYPSTSGQIVSQEPDFDAELQVSQPQQVCSSEAAARELAEDYTGLPIED